VDKPRFQVVKPDDNVVDINTPVVDRKLEVLLEMLLAQVRAGEILGIGCILLMNDDTHSGSIIISGEAAFDQNIFMLGMAERLKMAFMEIGDQYAEAGMRSTADIEDFLGEYDDPEDDPQ